MTTLSAFALHTSPQKGRKALGSPTFVKTQVIKLQPDLLKKVRFFSMSHQKTPSVSVVGSVETKSEC